MRDAVVLRRSAEVAHTLLVVAAAYSGALAVNAVLALWLESGSPPPTPTVEPASDGSASARADDQVEYSVIFERNLFGSEPVALTEPGQPQSTLADLRLRGTAEIDGRGFAVVEDTGQGRQDVFAVGERVFGGPKLVSVKPGRAVMLYKGRKHTLEITEPVGEAESKADKGDKSGKPSGGIRKTGSNTYLVDRREVDHTIENLNTVITQMRAVPYLHEGESLGFRVFNIRPGSIFERMGLQNGDVVQSVNGIALNSPSQAVGLLEDVQEAGEIRVNLMRNNSPNTLTYTVR